MSTKAIIIIPARMTSTRLPGKPLKVIAGLSMIERVCKIAAAVRNVSSFVVATDDSELAKFVENLGYRVVMTSSECRTGTDRVAEAAQKISQASKQKPEIVFSLQGDAVLTPPWVIEDLLDVMAKEPQAQIATPAVELQSSALTEFISSKQAGSSSGTCVTFDRKGYALYFSKALIPFVRSPSNAKIYRHIGLYGYRTTTLLQLSELPEGRFEQIEKLEQLRALEQGIPIRVVLVDYRGRTHASVDNPEDIGLVEEIISREGELV